MFDSPSCVAALPVRRCPLPAPLPPRRGGQNLERGSRFEIITNYRLAFPEMAFGTYFINHHRQPGWQPGWQRCDRWNRESTSLPVCVCVCVCTWMLELSVCPHWVVLRTTNTCMGWCGKPLRQTADGGS